MPISINELTVSVEGNVVKTGGGDGKSTYLRMTEDQALAIYDDLITLACVKARIANGAEKPQEKVFGNTGAPVTPVHVLKQEGKPQAAQTVANASTPT